MRYKYKSKTYDFTIEGDQIATFDEELGKLSADTVAGLKEEIRKHYDAAHNPKNKIKIITFGDRLYSDRDKTRFFEGHTTGIKADRYGYWVSWKDKDGTTRRAKLGSASFWIDSPENRTTLTAIVEKQKQMNTIYNEIRELYQKLKEIEGDK